MCRALCLRVGASSVAGCGPATSKPDEGQLGPIHPRPACCSAAARDSLLHAALMLQRHSGCVLQPLVARVLQLVSRRFRVAARPRIIQGCRAAPRDTRNKHIRYVLVEPPVAHHGAQRHARQHGAGFPSPRARMHACMHSRHWRCMSQQTLGHTHERRHYTNAVGRRSSTRRPGRGQGPSLALSCMSKGFCAMQVYAATPEESAGTLFRECSNERGCIANPPLGAC